MAKKTWESFRQSFLGTYGRAGLACPVCLREFSSAANVTEEHVPPESIGGRLTVPTCQECNHQWSRHEARLAAYATSAVDQGEPQRGAAAVVRLGRTTIRAWTRRLGADAVGIVFRSGQEDAARVFTEKLQRGLAQTEGFTVKRDPHRLFDDDVLRRCFIKAAYLALFWKFGYGLVGRKVYGDVRQQLLRPEAAVFDTLVAPVASKSQAPGVSFSAVIEPQEERVVIVNFERFVIRPGDAAAIDVHVALPLPSRLALNRLQRWKNAVLSQSGAAVVLLTERGGPTHGQNTAWQVQTEQGMIELFGPAEEQELARLQSSPRSTSRSGGKPS